MKEKSISHMIKMGSQRMIQQNLFGAPGNHSNRCKFISIFRITLVKDRRVAFEQCQLINSQQSQPLIRKLIETQGQPDREQFCVIMLNSKNEIIGLNIVSTGDLSSAKVHPREVLKPAILSNSAAMILCHNLCKALHKLCYVKHQIMLSKALSASIILSNGCSLQLSTSHNSKL